MDFTDFRDLILSLPEHAARHGEADCVRLLGGAVHQLSEQRNHLSEDDDQREMMAFRELIRPLVAQSEFCDYVFRKPRGYAGDFITQEMIWLGRTVGGEHRYRGSTGLGKLLTALTFDMPHCRANEERVRFLKERVRANGARKLASIGCGSCIELWEQSGMKHHDLLLLDQDSGALERARQQISPSIGKVRFLEQNILKFILGAAKEESNGSRDLVYAFGLFDYFDVPSARRLTKGLWQMVAPGGSLLITNARSDPGRFWMEYGGDWFLKYKDETQMRSLADGLEGVDKVSFRLDGQNIYQYLEVQRMA